MHPVEQYLSDMGAIRATQAGTGETSYYTALSVLLNEIGSTLNPKVRCVIQLQNKGAGMPDGGMFTADQFKTKAAKQNAGANPLTVLPPSRGVIEVKSPAEDMPGIIASEQIARYWEHYGLVLVTNYRAFTLIGRTPSGGAVELEGFTLAGTEAEFWKLAAHPRTCPDPVRERFAEYLHRVMIHNAPLASPQDVAAILASYARDAKARIGHADLPALAGLREALENALGLKFEGEKGEHFFRSTLIQTLFYGIFSAWVLWARKRKPASAAKEKTLKYALKESAAAYHADSKHFDWHTAVWHLRVPMIRALFEQVATPARLGPLGLEEVLDWAAAALNRVDGDAFFTAFDEGHAVQYFYEPFLQEFDPELRKDLGVWYTPTEIVDYQVERVDTVLREELHIADGLADPRVIVLDPCCGTGAYVRSVLHRIAKTLDAKGGDGLTAQDLKTAALERVLGFEILPAPFVIAHLQIGLLLETLGAPLTDAKDERVGVYLTNALTGWEPPKEPKTLLLFPEMAEERDAADRIKRRDSILVILGNPPYNGFAGVALAEERDLSNAYRTTRNAPPPQGQGLNDLYIRFFRMAERRIVEMNRPGQGIISFISNNSWLDNLSCPGMRERYLEVFDRIAIDNLNGDKFKNGKLTPEGDSDPSVFSTEYNREGIQVGTAIALLVKTAGSHKATQADRSISFRNFWGKTKRADLLADSSGYEDIIPSAALGFPFLPAKVAIGYSDWPLLPSLFPTSFPGVTSSRDDFVVAIDRAILEQRLKDFFNPELSHHEVSRLYSGVMTDSARYDSKKVRDYLLKRGGPMSNKIVRFCYRPFDTRWLYWEPETKLLDEKRTEFEAQVFLGNIFLEARQRQVKDEFDRGYLSHVLADSLGNGRSSFFPLYLHSDGSSLLEPEGKRPNLSDAAAAYLTGIAAGPDDLFYHALAVLHAPAYRVGNAGALRQDWPRVPLPATKAALLASAALGRQVAALLDTETPVAGVTAGKISEDLKAVAVFTRTDGQPVNPDAGDLELTAGWGHAGKEGVTMPGRGKVERSEVGDQRSAEHGVNPTSDSRLPTPGLDIYLNGQTFWRNVPVPVWEYTLGGYQVIKKWLSYREKPLLGRGLTIAEVRYVTETARRITALLALQPELDANYLDVTVDKPC